MKVESYSINGPLKSVCKQYGVWGHDGNTVYPLIYFQRPKWIKDDKAWEQIVNSVRLGLPTDFKVE